MEGKTNQPTDQTISVEDEHIKRAACCMHVKGKGKGKPGCV